MIPIRDENPLQGTPYVTLGIIALNVLVYLYQFTMSPQRELVFAYQYGVVPALLTGALEVPQTLAWFPQPLTLITSVFLHGGFLHLAGNMLYLWIFGNNVEDYLGAVRFILFYLVSGLGASLTHILTHPNSQVPMIGASGAIAGILGAYLLLYPSARIITLVFIFIVPIPAAIILIIWFVGQITNVGLGGGVAWFAHIGGFLIGMALIRYYINKERQRAVIVE